jgi:hypothetical protein
MLPDRSKRYAGIDGEIPRLRLATPWQLAMIAVIMIALLTVIFPRKALVEKLLTQERLDALTFSYVENLLRSDPGNVDLSLLLARVQRTTLSAPAMEQLLAAVLARGTPDQKLEARTLLVEVYERTLDRDLNPAQLARIRASLAATLAGIAAEEVSPRVAGNLAAAAFRIELPLVGLNFLNRANAAHSTELLVQQARTALGNGRYTLASEYYFLARKQTRDRDSARGYLHDGVAALMAASLFAQAMAAAERELGDLADDPDTLRYLARSALAAGDPPRAIGYARRLVFRELGLTKGTAR